MISVLVPSRSRPHRLAALLQSIRVTAQHDKVEVAVRLDSDDDVKAYKDMLLTFPDIKTALHVGPRPHYMSAAYNELFARTDGDIIYYGADDIVFEYLDWDKHAESVFKEQPITLLCDSDEGRTPIHGFVSRKACNALGYLFPGSYEHGYIDQYLHRLYSAIGRMVHSDRVKADHVHWHREAELYDETYRTRTVDRDEHGMTCDDRDKILFDRSQAMIANEAEKLRRLLA